jgi:hypothetical protein
MLSFPAVRGTAIDNVFAGLILALGLAAGVATFWTRWRIAAVFLVTYGLLILAWQWAVARFLVPLLPLLALAFFAGIHTVASRLRPHLANSIVIALAAAFCLTGTVRGWDMLVARMQCDREAPRQSPSCFNPDQLAFFAAAEHVRASLPPGATVLASKEATFHYLTASRQIPLSAVRSPSPATTIASLVRHDTRMIILGHLSVDDLDLARELRRSCDHLTLEKEFPPSTLVFRIAETTEHPASACKALAQYPTESAGFHKQIF